MSNWTNSQQGNSTATAGGGTAVAEKNPSEFNIRVLCRFRPLNDLEYRSNSSSIVRFPRDRDDTVFVGGKVYVFDKIFEPEADQQTVYEEAAKQIVADILNGYNGTIFAYGQTSSGKTYTMEGSRTTEAEQGIIPRIVYDIFDHIYAMDTRLQFCIKVSYFEIYMDRIRDLLDPTKDNLSVHEDKNRVPFVRGCTERFVGSPEEIFGVIDEGRQKRHFAVTNMNEYSSRSHSVFLIDVKQKNFETDKKLIGKLYLVDLAGSEKVSKTGAEGSVLDEARNINRSLSALGNVISALSDGTKTHVPYRDSKLTRILQESLGGNARTTVIICCSPASFNESETKSTLYFGQRAKMIKNTVIVNEELTAEEWKRRYDKEHERVVRLRGQLAAAEREILRWRSGQKVDPEHATMMHFDEDTSSCSDKLPTNTPRIHSSRQTTDHVIAEGSLTDDERVLIVETQCEALYRQLDEKDEEMNQLEISLKVSKDKLLEAEDTISKLQHVNETLQADQLSVRLQLEKSKEEVDYLMKGLNEICTNSNKKTSTLQATIKKHTDTISNYEAQIKQIEFERSKIEQYKQYIEYFHKYADKSLNKLANDLATIATDESDDMYSSVDSTDDLENLDDISEELKSIDMESNDLMHLNSNFDNRLTACKVSLAQARARASLQSNEIKTARTQLQQMRTSVQEHRESVDTHIHTIRELRIQVSSLLEDKEDLSVQIKSLQQSNHSVKTVDSELSTQLQCELDEKRGVIATLKERNSNLAGSNETLQAKIDEINRENLTLKSKLDELNVKNQNDEKARKELLALERTVAKELQSLTNIRKSFVNKLISRVQKPIIVNPEMSINLSSINVADKQIENDSENISHEDISSALSNFNCEGYSSAMVNKQKVEFLEDNLKNLTNVHKELAKENAELHLEIPKLEKRLSTAYNRLHCLESALKEARESAIKDRARYITEVNRIRDVVKSRNVYKRMDTPQIVKPIKGGGGQIRGLQNTHQQQQQSNASKS